MGRSLWLKQNGIHALWVLVITLASVSVCVWTVPVSKTWVLWTFRLMTPMAAVAAGIWLYRVCQTAEVLPDLLRQVARKYFEQSGLCFVPTIETTSQGTSQLNIYFQNRHSGHACATIGIGPLNALFASRKPAAVTAAIECPGGAFGVYRIPLPIPAASQGKRMAFAVGADTKYPVGRGKMLRLRTGIRVGATRELKTSHQLGSTLVLLVFGMLSTSAPAHATLTLPRGVSEAPPKNPDGQLEILWRPDQPEGFPLSPKRVAA